MTDAAPPIAADTAAMGGRRHLLIDLASSYALSVARVASMAAMVAILFRYLNAEYAATFVLIRTMLGMLNNVFSGVGPAAQRTLTDRSSPAIVALAEPLEADGTLPYRSLNPIARELRTDFASRFGTIVLCTFSAYVVASVAVAVYAYHFRWLHEVAVNRTEVLAPFVALFGAGMLVRALAEPAGALLQLRRRLAMDNAVQIAGECAWPLCCAYLVISADDQLKFARAFNDFGWSFLLVSLGVACARGVAATMTIAAIENVAIAAFDGPLRVFIGRSVTASIGSLADYLYAPASVLIISACIHPRAVADYTPALQFDGALLLLVGAIAATILPRAMRLAGEHRNAELRALYLRSTFVSLALLASAATALWIASPMILRLWLGQPMPVTLSVLPFVLIHTVVGGTAGVGRATLLAMGRFRAYTISAVVGGVANVGLALLFVVGFGWGLRGVAMATIVAVVARCAIWMPWYVLRATR